MPSLVPEVYAVNNIIMGELGWCGKKVSNIKKAIPPKM